MKKLIALVPLFLLAPLGERSKLIFVNPRFVLKTFRHSKNIFIVDVFYGGRFEKFECFGHLPDFLKLISGEDDKAYFCSLKKIDEVYEVELFYSLSEYLKTL